MKKELEDMLLSLARPIGLFRKELVDNGVPEEEATKIVLVVFGFTKQQEESGSPVPGVTVKH